MKNANEKSLSCEWLTYELIQEVKKVFEPQYKRNLSNDEVVEIAEHLADFFEVIYQFKYEEQYEKPDAKQNPA